jgi:hypothetical protein
VWWGSRNEWLGSSWMWTTSKWSGVRSKAVAYDDMQDLIELFRHNTWAQRAGVRPRRGRALATGHASGARYA